MENTLKGIAGIITAVAALLGILYSVGVIGHKDAPKIIYEAPEKS